MASPENKVSGDVIDAIRPDLEAFASLWSALRANYEGTNITKTIARLLNMYQPEDGIQAYERLLKTLFILLEDFDGNGLRLLVSMVPLPKGSTAETIKEVFFKATGFLRIDAPIVYQNVNSDSLIASVNSNDMSAETMENNENISSKPKNLNQTTTESESNQLSQDYYPLRGFPQSEVIFSQNQKIPQYFNYDQGHQYYYDRSAESAGGCKLNWLPAPILLQNGTNTSTSYRDLLVKTVDNKYIRMPVTHYNPSVHYYTRPYQVMSDKMQTTENHTITSATTNVAETQVSGALISTKSDENNGNSIDKVPRSDLLEHNYGLRKNSETKQENDLRIANNDHDEPKTLEEYTLNNLTPSNNLTASIKRFLSRAKTATPPCTTKSKIHESTTNDQMKKSFSQTPKLSDKFTAEFRDKTNYPKDTDALYDYSYQPNSMSELAAYKRQYYDALLNIQRAKMAVANSLTMSSMPNCSDYDSYHPDYWMYQQPSQRLIVGPSYTQRFVQPEYPSVHNSCLRTSDWMSSYSASRLPENPMLHSSIYNSRFFYTPHHESTSQTHPPEAKVEAKKRKLENIVVKLKEGEMTGTRD